MVCKKRFQGRVPSGLWKEPRNCFKHRSVKDLFNKGLSMLNCGSLQASQQLYKELIG